MIPDIFINDISMLKMDGFEKILIFQHQNPNRKPSLYRGAILRFVLRRLLV